VAASGFDPGPHPDNPGQLLIPLDLEKKLIVLREARCSIAWLGEMSYSYSHKKGKVDPRHTSIDPS
jgi:hypothetical protein